ncbi:MAG: hypothetical protein ABH865_01345 [Candidatus Omnitrophota bacterium]
MTVTKHFLRVQWVHAASFVAVSFLFLGSVVASIDIPLPAQTEAVSKSQETSTPTEKLTVSQYRSGLSRDEIMGFYELELSTRGWKKFNPPEGNEYLYKETLIYVKEGIITFTLIMLPSSEQGKVFYNTVIAEPKKIVVLRQTFKPPRQLDFMPVPPNVTEFVYNTFYAPMIGIAYLTHSDVYAVSDYYLSNMSKFGWNLKGNVVNEGMYAFSQWVLIIDPFTKAIPSLEATGFAQLVPPLSVKGRTLTFTQGKKSCTIAIYKFDDILAKAVGTLFDMSFMAEHGTTAICIYYFYDEKK